MNVNLLKRTDIFLNAHIKNTRVFNNASKIALGLNKVKKKKKKEYIFFQNMYLFHFFFFFKEILFCCLVKVPNSKLMFWHLPLQRLSLLLRKKNNEIKDKEGKKILKKNNSH